MQIFRNFLITKFTFVCTDLSSFFLLLRPCSLLIEPLVKLSDWRGVCPRKFWFFMTQIFWKPQFSSRRFLLALYYVWRSLLWSALTNYLAMPALTYVNVFFSSYYSYLLYIYSANKQHTTTTTNGATFLMTILVSFMGPPPVPLISQG